MRCFVASSAHRRSTFGVNAFTGNHGLRAQIDGINQAISNSQDSNNLIKTAEGGLSEVNSLLRSIRQLGGKGDLIGNSAARQ